MIEGPRRLHPSAGREPAHPRAAQGRAAQGRAAQALVAQQRPAHPRALSRTSALAAAAVLAFLLVLFLPLFPALCLEESSLQRNRRRDSGSGNTFGGAAGGGHTLGAAASSRIGVFSPILLSDADTFEISYTHSVNKGRVTDLYTVGPDGITLKATRFVSYGAGMNDPGSGNTFTSVDGRFEIGNIQLHIPVLLLAVGVIADHELSYAGRTRVLSDIWPPQTTLAISYRRASVFDYIRSTIHDR